MLFNFIDYKLLNIYLRKEKSIRIVATTSFKLKHFVRFGFILRCVLLRESATRSYDPLKLTAGLTVNCIYTMYSIQLVDCTLEPYPTGTRAISVLCLYYVQQQLNHLLRLSFNFIVGESIVHCCRFARSSFYE